jgi:hypothetical protein
MEAHRVTLRDGSTAILYCSESGSWACPICGSVELSQPPYYSDGSASFDMCSCGFEFGYDDDPGASPEADPSVPSNWSKWRARFLRKVQAHPGALAQVTERLRAIGVAV